MHHDINTTCIDTAAAAAAAPTPTPPTTKADNFVFHACFIIVLFHAIIYFM